MRVPPLRVVAAAVGCAGLVCLVAGTFLPWLYSGRRTRNSYAAGGAARQLLGLGDVANSALTAWPFVVFACAAAIAALLLGWRAIAQLLAALAAAAAAAGSLAVLAADSVGLIRPATVGPIVTLVGSATVLAAITINVLIARSNGGRQK